MTPPTSHEAGHGPTDRARLARALREARRAAGIGGIEAGRRAGISQSKVSKVERGLLVPTVSDVQALSEVYGLAAADRDHLCALAAGLREESSARVILSRGVANFQRRIGEMESSGSLVRSFQPVLVPGTLQTADYSRCVFRAAAPGVQLPEEEVEAAVTERLTRRARLGEDGTRHRIVVTEGALRWQACSARTMAEQTETLLSALSWPGVMLGLIPWSTPVRVFPGHGFHIYDEDAVIVGTETATATLTSAADLATYRDLFTALEGTARFGADARPHLERIAAEYRALDAEPDGQR
ncbi:helix-turn-helix protein [Haloactinospora alba]|uniref:Helix-turn-helix protein n=1 Tax=Haloactinospora alba TaxID=405555 RepID=A0A543NM64_9ACTN|nr:helix-turn-helix transcriptional regulator [Haloactinospora alba]TQN32918.1 helix-turn-helix protein [Haloactinospora alba]